MAEIINLNRFRKAKQQRQRQEQASENRVRHGRPKSTVNRDKTERDEQRRDHDGKHLEPDDDGQQPA